MHQPFNPKCLGGAESPMLLSAGRSGRGSPILVKTNPYTKMFCQFLPLI
jgi:hypothetical protein